MHIRDFTKDDGLVVGDDISIPFEVFQDDLVTAMVADGNGIERQTYVSGTPQDIAGWTLAFAVRLKDTSSGAPVLSKTTSAGITITGTYNATRASNTQRAVVAIADTDTFSDAGAVLVAPKTYRYSLKRTDPGSEKTLVGGKFVLLQKPVRA